MKLQLLNEGAWGDVRKEGTHYCVYIHQKGQPTINLQCRGSVKLALADALIHGVKLIQSINGQTYDQNKLDKMLNQKWFDNLEDYLKSKYVAYFN